MSLAISSPDEIVHAIAECDQTEQIALLFGGQRQQQRSCDVALQNSRVGIARVHISRDWASAQARSIQNDVNLLCSLDLKNARDGMTMACSGFPIYLVEAVAGGILSELFELPSFANLALAVDT